MDNLMGHRIHEKRIEQGLTMEELGDMVGVKSSAVNKWEKGTVENIKRETIAELSKIFHCSPVWLMGFDTPMTIEKVKEIAKDDADVLNMYHKLNDRDKSIIKNMMESMLSS